MRCVGILGDAIAPGDKRAHNRAFDVKGLIRGITNLHKNRFLIGPNGVQEHGIAHFGLDVEILLGNRGVNGCTPGKDRQRGKDSHRPHDWGGSKTLHLALLIDTHGRVKTCLMQTEVVSKSNHTTERDHDPPVMRSRRRSLLQEDETLRSAQGDTSSVSILCGLI